MYSEIRYDWRLDGDMIDRFGDVAETGQGIGRNYVLGLILVLIVGYAALYFLGATYDTEPARNAARSFGPLGLVIGLIAASALIMAVSFKSGKAVEETFHRIGQMSITIDEYGIKVRSSDSDVNYRWGAVLDVRSMETGIGINIYGTNFIALPNECLPEGLGHDRAVALINGWRQA